MSALFASPSAYPSASPVCDRRLLSASPAPPSASVVAASAVGRTARTAHTSPLAQARTWHHKSLAAGVALWLSPLSAGSPVWPALPSSGSLALRKAPRAAGACRPRPPLAGRGWQLASRAALARRPSQRWIRPSAGPVGRAFSPPRKAPPKPASAASAAVFARCRTARPRSTLGPGFHLSETRKYAGLSSRA
eukprot:scaffold88820_cov63-Phaeocystis_antarctica.AAC.1